MLNYNTGSKYLSRNVQFYDIGQGVSVPRKAASERLRQDVLGTSGAIILSFMSPE